MAEITATLVKELREKTGAGMMDCKRALGETGGDLETAVDWLRKKGLATAAKKASRVASEGLVGVAVRGPAGAAVEVNSETDFVARNDRFQGFVGAVAALAVEAERTVDELRAATLPGTGRTVDAELTLLIGSIGENLNLRRAKRLTVAEGVIGSYVHGPVAPGLGRIGVLVALESKAAPAALDPLARQLAMHIAAARPDTVTMDEVEPAALERERDVLAEQARTSGKPEAVIAKMVEGRLRKYYEEVVLLEQVWVIDGERRVKQVLEQAAKELGAAVKVTGFVRFALGEGVAKKDGGDFAAEVAATLAPKG